MTSPLVSVVLPVRNGAADLLKAIDTILEQTFTDFELIVVNDGSTDGTAAVLDAIRDPRVRLVHQENTGLVRALNRGNLRALHRAAGPRRPGEADTARKAGGVHGGESRLRPGRHLRGRPEQVLAWANERRRSHGQIARVSKADPSP
jgi:Glycosyl transferase family 2